MSHDLYRRLFRDRDLPLAFVDLDRFDDNARALVARASGLPIRVASKSVRCRALVARALGHAGMRGVMCFHARAASFLAAHGFDDLLVAYPTVDSEAVRAACAAAREGTRIALVVDEVAHLELLSGIA